MAIIMVDSKPQLRPISINAHTEVNIDEIDWCVNIALTRDAEVYAILQGQKSKLTDIVRLAPMQPYDKNHIVYRIIPNTNLRVNDELVYARLLILKKGQSGLTTTNSIAFVIETDNYALARQVAVAQDLGLAVETYYKAIVEMYNELKKGEIVDDNESC